MQLRDLLDDFARTREEISQKFLEVECASSQEPRIGSVAYNSRLQLQAQGNAQKRMHGASEGHTYESFEVVQSDDTIATVPASPDDSGSGSGCSPPSTGKQAVRRLLWKEIDMPQEPSLQIKGASQNERMLLSFGALTHASSSGSTTDVTSAPSLPGLHSGVHTPGSQGGSSARFSTTNEPEVQVEGPYVYLESSDLGHQLHSQRSVPCSHPSISTPRGQSLCQVLNTVRAASNLDAVRTRESLSGLRGSARSASDRSQSPQRLQRYFPPCPPPGGSASSTAAFEVSRGISPRRTSTVPLRNSLGATPQSLLAGGPQSQSQRSAQPLCSPLDTNLQIDTLNREARRRSGALTPPLLAGSSTGICSELSSTGGAVRGCPARPPGRCRLFPAGPCTPTRSRSLTPPPSRSMGSRSLTPPSSQQTNLSARTDIQGSFSASAAVGTTSATTSSQPLQCPASSRRCLPSKLLIDFALNLRQELNELRHMPDIQPSVDSVDIRCRDFARPIVHSSLLSVNTSMGPTEIPGVGVVEGAKSVARLLLPRLRSSVAYQVEPCWQPIEKNSGHPVAPLSAQLDGIAPGSIRRAPIGIAKEERLSGEALIENL